jgi:hypothetical protein
MTRKVQVVLQDDIDGTQADQTVRFALDGTEYEIDLNDEHASQLRDGMASWIAAARRASMARIPEPRSKARRSADTADIRHWAEANGIPVAARGRLSRDLRTQYEATH